MPISVLLADDHAVVRDGLRFLLEAEGDIQVVCVAGDGREAVQQVRLHHPQVVVMDIAMSILNGIEATRQILEEFPETQVVILTIYSTPEHIYRALQSGALGYLLKESAGAEVVAAVRAVHMGRRYLSQKISDTVLANSVNVRGKSPLESLSHREREVLQLTVEGKTSVEIAAVLSISSKTVETYRSRLMQKLGLSDMPALVRFAILHGITSLEGP